MLAAESARLRELMARMGHSSTRAALIYQHASRDRERAIGAAISARVEAVRPGPIGQRADRARNGHEGRRGGQGDESAGTRKAPLTWAGALGAGDGNRTRIVSLGTSAAQDGEAGWQQLNRTAVPWHARFGRCLWPICGPPSQARHQD
jgi:hypothetical protein